MRSHVECAPCKTHVLWLSSRYFTQDDAETMVNDDDPSENMADDGNEEDQGLKNAATIGTSLMVINSHRALFIL